MEKVTSGVFFVFESRQIQNKHSPTSGTAWGVIFIFMMILFTSKDFELLF